MQAIRHHGFGPPDVLRLEELLDLHPGHDQVRVAVEASGVHLLDTSIRRGEPGPFPSPPLPTTPGREVAGVVDTVGEGVDQRWLGRRVVAHLGAAGGGYAEQALVGVGALRIVPDGLSAAAAVALIGTGRTAVAVLDHAGLHADDVVVVTAAAGGLGSLFVQAARHAGATVVALAGGADKVARLEALGVDVAVDYGRAGWVDEVRSRLDAEATLVLDGVGGELGRGAFELLGAGGRIVLFGWSSGTVTPFTSADLADRGLSASWSIGPAMMKRWGTLEPLERQALADAVAGVWTPLLTCFPLADAAGAHRAIESRATIGKTVLVQ